MTSILAQRQPRGGASAASGKFCRAKRGTQDKVQYHSPAVSKHHENITSILAQGQRRGGASAASEEFCDKLRSEDGVAKTSSFQDQSEAKPPRISPFRYFTHFVLFFMEANEKTPEEKAAEKEKHAEREITR